MYSTLFQGIMCVINHDVRSSMLLHGIDYYEWRIASGIRKELLKFIGEGELLPRGASFREYCGVILEPRKFLESLVRYSKESRCEATYWRLTHYGNIYLQPAAARSIRAANNFNVSTFEIFGKTGAPLGSESTSAFNVARILLSLHEIGRRRYLGEAELSNQLQLYLTDTRDHCISLQDIGLIKRELIKRGKTILQITEKGEEITEESVLPIKLAAENLTYTTKEFRKVWEEYMEDPKLMKAHISSALELLLDFKRRELPHLVKV